MKLLVKAEFDWADEFDVAYLNVFTDVEWKRHLEFAEKVFKKHGEYTVGFGTNEEVEYSSFADYTNRFKVTKITDEQYKFLKTNVTGKHWFGQNLLIDEVYYAQNYEF